MELDERMMIKWDQAADDMISQKVILLGIQSDVGEIKQHSKDTNGQVEAIAREQILLRGMVIATMAIVTLGGAVAGIAVAVIQIGGGG